MSLKVGDIIVSRNHGLFSRLVRWWTQSEWSHVRVMIGPTHFVEATWPAVRVGEIEEVCFSSYQLFTPREPLTAVQQMELVQFLMAQVGKAYDWRGVLSLLFKVRVQNKAWFYCCELAAAGYAKIRRPLFRLNASLSRPQDIYQSLELAEVA